MQIASSLASESAASDRDIAILAAQVCARLSIGLQRYTHNKAIALIGLPIPIWSDEYEASHLK